MTKKIFQPFSITDFKCMVIGIVVDIISIMVFVFPNRDNIGFVIQDLGSRA